MAITDWPCAERPREKLIQRGADALSDAELLAILLRTGVNGRSAVDLARDLIQEFGSLRGLLETERQRFCRVRGMGLAKFAELQAMLELGRRYLREGLHRASVMDSPQAARDYLVSVLRHRRHEVFACLFLDTRHRVIDLEELFQGTIDGASVHPRVIVQRALDLNAAAVILVHNHPSGVAEPSGADERITRRIKDALALVDIRTLDHLIVGDIDCVSMAERGLL